MNLPYVTWAAPKKMSSPLRENPRRSSAEVYGSVDTCMIVESSTKKYPNRKILYPEMLHLKTAQWTASTRQFSMGVLKIAHILGEAILPCPRPWEWRFEGKGPLIAPIEGIQVYEGGTD